MKKIAFLGSKEVGYFALNHLITHAKELNIEIIAVLSNDRKLTESGNSILELAQNNQIPILNSADDLIDLNHIDYILSVQYHEILNQTHIDCAKKLAVNLHMAPLPEYRGCNQFSFAIIDDAKEFGTTLHVLESGIDSGDILFESRFPISKNETVNTLHQKTTEQSIKLFQSHIEDLIKNNYTRVPQQSFIDKRAFGFHLRNEISSIKHIDLTWSDDKIDRHVRATYFPPFAPPFAIINNKKIELSLDWKNEIKNASIPLVKTNAKKIASLVTNDLHQDQRMNRICTALTESGFDVTLIGRKRKSSKPLDSKPFHRLRLNCWFERSILFYIEYNIRLFFHLLINKYDIINANDLDTVLPAIWAGKLRGSKIVYDAHEYFTEQEEVVNRPTVKRIWKMIESFSIPRVDAAYTVSKGYANLFEAEYKMNFKIVRNATILRDSPKKCDKTIPYILYQGAVNYGRGLEELIVAMKSIDCQLYICGDGDVLTPLKQQTNELELNSKVKFFGFVEPEKLREFTCGAKIGLTLFAKAGLSHWHSLANRFFDYMHSGVPQVAMSYPEYVEFNKNNEVAVLIDSIEPDNIAYAINNLLTDQALYNRLSKNALIAKKHANWQAQETVLVKIYQDLL